MSHTYVVLTLSKAAYREIKEKLKTAGYQDQFYGDAETPTIDMHGIAITCEIGDEE